MFLAFLVEYLFRVSVRAINLLRSHRWPLITGTVFSTACPNVSYGCTVANVDYEYMVDGAKYAGCYEKPFVVHASGVAYASCHRV
jgi:hypothetical protein